MGDVMPDYGVERKRLEHQRLTILHTVSGQELRLMEMEAETRRLLENIEASHRAVAELDTKIAAMITGKEQSDG